MDSGSLSRHKEQEISEIKRSRRRLRRNRLIFISLLILFLSFIFSSWHRQGVSGDEEGVSDRWEELLSQSGLQQDWLRRHATGIELRVYEIIEDAVLAGVDPALDETPVEETAEHDAPPTFLQELGYQLRKVSLRVSFYLIAAFRIWFLAAVLGLVAGARHLSPYTERDLLGLTGNGRLFFSGIRAVLSLERGSSEPALLVPGLACPSRCDEGTLSASMLGRLLNETGTSNATNAFLASVIVAHADQPAFIAGPGEERALAQFVVPLSLEENACILLETLLGLHAEFRGQSGDRVGGSALSEKHAGPMEADAYASFLGNNFRRVMQPAMREAAAWLAPAELATLILAMEAGKVLARKMENGAWVKSSSFPHLSARAVLHAAPVFGEEYHGTRRSQIRRAIIYASRYNIFGMVRFPLDLDDTTRGCRQWTELMLACPHELQVCADEVELFGIMSETNRLFAEVLFEEVASLRHFSAGEVFTSGTNLLLVPLDNLCSLLRRAIQGPALKRLEELTFLVSQKQVLKEISVEKKSEDEPSSSPFRVMKPLTFPEMKRLSDLHGVSLELLKAWSPLRAVLSNFAWLARRVGNSSVPDSALVFVVLKAMEGAAQSGDVVGKCAMVPLRGSRLRERFGPSWQSHFVLVDAVAMAENREEFEHLISLGPQAFLDEDDNMGDSRE